MSPNRRPRRLHSGWKSKAIILAVLFGPVVVLVVLFALLATIYDAELDEMGAPAGAPPAEPVPG